VAAPDCCPHQEEVAFFVLELRLMRKVEPHDFDPPAPDARTQPATKRRTEALEKPVLRVVSVRHSLEATRLPAATIEDRVESPRYVLEPGDTLPPYPAYRLVRIEEDRAVLESEGEEIVLQLAPRGDPLGQRLRPSERAKSAIFRSLLSRAEQGAQHGGLMAQWRNVGLRGRPQLLQQAWLTPAHSERTDGRMLGLRVRKLAEGSFWHQLGLQQGDLLTGVNGSPVDSLHAWQEAMQVARNDQSITVTLERSAEQLRFRTRTIRPR